MSNSSDFWFRLSRGDISDLDPLAKFGRNSDIAMTTFEDVWDGSSVRTEPTASRIHNLVSSHIDDDGFDAGDGARTIRVFGLDANYDKQQEDRTLNGQVIVPTQKSYRDIYRMRILTAGDTGFNAGNITATAVTDGTVTAQISIIDGIGMNKTLMAIYTVPNNEEGGISSFYASMNKRTNASVDIFLMVKRPGGVWEIENVQGIISTGSSRFRHIFADDIMTFYEAKTIIKVGALSSAASVDISAGFGYVGRRIGA